MICGMAAARCADAVHAYALSACTLCPALLPCVCPLVPGGLTTFGAGGHIVAGGSKRQCRRQQCRRLLPQRARPQARSARQKTPFLSRWWAPAQLSSAAPTWSR